MHRALPDPPSLDSASLSRRLGELAGDERAVQFAFLTEENVEGLVARAAFKTKAEAELLVASLAARSAPKEGLRGLPGRSEAASAAAPDLLAAASSPSPSPRLRGEGRGEGSATSESTLPPPPPPTRPAIRPLDGETYSCASPWTPPSTRSWISSRRSS